MISPVLLSWSQRDPKLAVPPVIAAGRESGAPALSIPVEVIPAGGLSEWRHVEVPATMVPEPGVIPLALLAGLLMLRRRR